MYTDHVLKSTQNRSDDYYKTINSSKFPEFWENSDHKFWPQTLQKLSDQLTNKKFDVYVIWLFHVFDQSFEKIVKTSVVSHQTMCAQIVHFLHPTVANLPMARKQSVSKHNERDSAMNVCKRKCQGNVRWKKI